MAQHTSGRWVFKRHSGFGERDPDGELWPFGYISSLPQPLPIFQLDVIIDRPRDELTGRENASPRDPNSPHELLVAAVEAIDKAEGRH